jgi:surface protein
MRPANEAFRRGDEATRNESTDGLDFKQQVESVEETGASDKIEADAQWQEETPGNDLIQRRDMVVPGAKRVYPDGREESIAMEDTIVDETNSTTNEGESRSRENVLAVAYPVTSMAESLDNQGPRNLFLLSFVGFLLLVGALLGGVCGSGHCSQDDESASTQPTPAASMPAAPMPAVPTPMAYKSFTSTDELYQAVDIYILNLTRDRRESIVARTYGYPIGTWDVSNIKNFSQVFAPVRRSRYELLRPPKLSSNFNEDISGWNVSSAETMFGMFYRCNHFNRNLSLWDVRNVQDMSYMFWGAVAFNGDISGWNTSAATDMLKMFEFASSFDQNLCSWGQQASALDYVTNMFADSGCRTKDSPYFGDFSIGPWCQACSPTISPTQHLSSLPSFVPSEVPSSLDSSFVPSDVPSSLASSVASDVPSDLSSTVPTRMPEVAKGSTSPPTTAVEPPSIVPESAVPTIIRRPTSLPAVDKQKTSPPTTAVESPSIVPESAVPTIIRRRTSLPTSPPTWLILPQPDTVAPTSASSPFRVFTSTEELYDAVDEYLGTEIPETTTVAELYGYPIRTWDVSQITNFYQVFSQSRNRRAISFNGDISTWDASSATDMSYMFDGAIAFNGDISRWNTSSVTFMTGMFANAESFNGDLSAWSTGSVSQMGGMFYNAASFNQDLSGWNVEQVTFMPEMFRGAASFNQDLCFWGNRVIVSVYTVDMFADSGCPVTDSPERLNLSAGPWCNTCLP